MTTKKKVQFFLKKFKNCGNCYCGLFLALSIIHVCVISNNKNCTSDKFKAVFAYTPTQNSLMYNYLVLIIKLNLGGDWGVLLLNGRVLVLILLVSML